MNKDYYKILEIDKGASHEEIKKAYRKLAHLYHPDKKGGSEAKFKEINEAYQVLSDPKKREQYDRFGSNFENANFGGNANSNSNFGGFEDIFGQFSGGGFEGADFDLGDILGNMFGGGARSSAANLDMHISIDISLEEAFKGAKKEVSLKKNVVCDECGGKGYPKDAELKTCNTCKGTGKVRNDIRTPLGFFSQTSICPTCKGKGKIPSKTCPKCSGKGFVYAKKDIYINIPAGIKTGQTIKVSKEGEATSDSVAGNLYVDIRVVPDKKFTREGNDINVNYELLFTQAALGDKISIDTLDGSVILKIPAGTSSGDIFRIKNKGMSVLNSSKRGDMYVKIKVKVPKNVSGKAKTLLEELKKEGL